MHMYTEYGANGGGHSKGGHQQENIAIVTHVVQYCPTHVN